jgi:hypothetical protein
MRMSNCTNKQTLGDLLLLGREIWGTRRMRLPEIAVAMGVVYGDVCRAVRDDKPEALVAELGNMILSTLRWCDDLNIDFDDALHAAKVRQALFANTLKKGFEPK